MTEFKSYLAEELVASRNTVSYRLLARTLKVHVNAAKCMLYEYHEAQNKRKPGSVYATYMLAGTKKQAPQPNGKEVDVDASMRSSPPASSVVQSSQQRGEDINVKTVTLVREENLDDVKSTYETITSIHIYSLSPTKLPDLYTLIDTSRALYTDVFAKENPLTHNKIYGVIQNPQVRRRKGKRPIPPPAAAPKFQAVKEDKPSTTRPTPSLKKEDSKSIASSFKSTPTTLQEEDSKTSTISLKKETSRESTPKLKRDASDLFKAFAKSGSNTKKPTPTQQKADTPMSGMTDDDDGDEADEEDDVQPSDKEASKKRASEVRQEREDKAAKLRKMMEDDDDDNDEDTVPAVEDAAGLRKDDAAAQKDDEEGEVAWSDSDGEAKKAAPKKEEDAGPKRKRGKRKVMKKKTTKDADGYLVTREEEAWESFSESDREDEKKKTATFGGFKSKPASQMVAKKGGDGKKGAAAGGGAGGGKKDIASFFKKK